MKQADPSDVTAFWARVTALVDQRARAIVKEELLNHRPRGAANVAMSAGGTPGSVIVASLIVPCVAPRIDFPIEIDEVYLQSDVDCTLNCDVWVQRPGQLAALAASIVGATLPGLVASREATRSPVSDAWTSTHIEAGSVVSLYVTATDGLASSLTLTLCGRCV